MPIGQESRLAMNAIEPLQRLSEELKTPGAIPGQVSVYLQDHDIVSKIDGLINDLNNLVGVGSGTSADQVKQEMQQEHDLRSKGQQARHARLVACEPGKTDQGPKRTRLVGPPRQGVPGVQRPQVNRGPIQ